MITIAISPGELLDKISILKIKRAEIGERVAASHVQHELQLLERARDAAIRPSAQLAALVAELETVNRALWDIEDALRRHERAKDFSENFVELARQVYHTNDHRAALKKHINLLLASDIVEEKHYVNYAG